MSYRKPITYYFDQDVLIGNYVSQGELDDNGDLVGRTGWVDGGDTCQRVGMYYMAMLYNGFDDVKDEFEAALNLLESKNSPGLYIRHPDKNYWYSDEDRMSRDQITPILCATGAWGMKDKLWRIFKNHLGRLLFFARNMRRNGVTEINHGKKYLENAKPLNWFQKLVVKYRIPFLNLPKGYRNYNWRVPDLTLFSIWSMYIRGFNLWFLYPILVLFDLEYLVNALLIRTKIRKEVNIENHVVEGVYFSKKYKTPTVWFTNKYINDPDDLYGRLYEYFNWPRAPFFMAEIYKDLIYKELTR